jgi:hypothetical protein
MDDHLPGGEILRQGLEDLAAGSRSVTALLVLVAAPRLRRCGVSIPTAVRPTTLPEHDLYRLLCREHGPDAYRHYRSLLRRLVSLEQALELAARGQSSLMTLECH